MTASTKDIKELTLAEATVNDIAKHIDQMEQQVRDEYITAAERNQLFRCKSTAAAERLRWGVENGFYVRTSGRLYNRLDCIELITNYRRSNAQQWRPR